MGFEGGHGIKYAFKRGEQSKNMVCKGGGVTKKIPLNLVVTAFMVMQISVPECPKKLAFLRF